eukprot:TRINITY_DN1139_c1_g2_i3.p3 TRINITY_DN1139_c1_g2~~TRINITY_DN1139_c1_g2_i3.p3  ORF type:complete len:123 (+),score=13.62 TRINITY_DN1139_c1_g2_i3:51-371(+)
MTAYLRPGEGWLKWLYTGVGIYTAAVATTMLYFSGRQMLPPVRVGACRFDDLAEVYDEQLGWDEFMMGLESMLCCQLFIWQTSKQSDQNACYFFFSAHPQHSDSSK